MGVGGSSPSGTTTSSSQGCRAIATVLIPIPSRDFDPTEVAVSWRVLTALGHEVRFATPDGGPAAADQIMLDGIGLDPWPFALMNEMSQHIRSRQPKGFDNAEWNY